MTGPRRGFFAEQDIPGLDVGLETRHAGRGLGQAVSPRWSREIRGRARDEQTMRLQSAPHPKGPSSRTQVLSIARQ